MYISKGGWMQYAWTQINCTSIKSIHKQSKPTNATQNDSNQHKNDTIFNVVIVVVHINLEFTLRAAKLHATTIHLTRLAVKQTTISPQFHFLPLSKTLKENKNISNLLQRTNLDNRSCQVSSLFRTCRSNLNIV